MSKKLISVVTPCYNEEANVHDLIVRVISIFKDLPEYDFEHIFIDNSSTDNTRKILRKESSKHDHIRVIFNSRNFGHIRSPYYGMLQSKGDATILLFCDLQDPPELIKDFLMYWEQGYDTVIGRKKSSGESKVMFLIRCWYYKLIGYLSEMKLEENFNGFGLFDRKVVESFRQLNDPYPYFRGIVHEVGFHIKVVDYIQAARKRGITKNNFFTLYDIAMLGITNHSRLPLRFITLFGFIFSLISVLIGFSYLVYKLMYWENFSVGIAPLVIGVFFLSSFLLLSVGVLGEYIGFIYTKVQNRPLVFEQERINFKD